MKLATTVIAAVFCILLVVLVFGVTRTNAARVTVPLPPAAKTGAPSEATCADCHTGGTSQNGSLAIQFGGTEYVPGQTYAVGVALQDPGQQRWGFELTVLKNSNNTTAGVLQNANTLTGVQTFGGRAYIGHNSNGTGPPPPVDPNDGTFWGVFDGPVEWVFNWTAPPQGTGPVTFWAAGNAANGNDLSGAGDRIYTTTLTLAEGVPTPVTTTTWGKIKQRYR